MGYYILHRPDSSTDSASEGSPSELAVLRARMEGSSTAERLQAALRLVELRAEGVLTQCLASSQSEVVQTAANALWECWHAEAGASARVQLEQGIDAMNLGYLDEAADVFTELMTLHPHWAEASNKLAMTFYLQGKSRSSLELCREVVRLKPDHFGAWNGMALCAIQIEDWNTALHAVEESLRLQPHSQMNRQLLQLVRSRLLEV